MGRLNKAEARFWAAVADKQQQQGKEEWRDDRQVHRWTLLRLQHKGLEYVRRFVSN